MKQIDDVPFLPTKTPFEIPDIYAPAAAPSPTVSIEPDRLPLARFQKYAEQIQATLLEFCVPDHCVICGSVRRRREVCGDVDLVVLPKPDQIAALRDRVKRNKTVFKDGEQNLIVRLPLTDGKLIQIDVFIARQPVNNLFDVTPTNFASLILCRTGSAAFNIWLAERAAHLGKHFDPYRGITEGDKLIAHASELEILQAVKLDWIRPEDRER